MKPFLKAAGVSKQKFILTLFIVTIGFGSISCIHGDAKRRDGLELNREPDASAFLMYPAVGPDDHPTEEQARFFRSKALEAKIKLRSVSNTGQMRVRVSEELKPLILSNSDWSVPIEFVDPDDPEYPFFKDVKIKEYRGSPRGCGGEFTVIEYHGPGSWVETNVRMGLYQEGFGVTSVNPGRGS